MTWERQSVGFWPPGSSVLFPLDRETSFSPCLPGPDSTSKNRGLVGAPPCGYCSDDCHLCYKTKTDVLGGGAGQVRGLCRAPGLLPAAVSWFSSQCLSCTLLLHPSPHNPTPPCPTPAYPRGSSHTLCLIQDIIILDPGQGRTQSFLGRSPSCPGRGELEERGQVSQVNKVSEAGVGDPLETALQ